MAGDSEPICRLLSEVLELQGSEVDICSSGTGALRKAMQLDTDVLILDARNPEKTGLEGVRAQGHRVPIILMTSGLSEEVQCKCGDLSDLTLLDKLFGLVDWIAAVHIASYENSKRSLGSRIEPDWAGFLSLGSLACHRTPPSAVRVPMAAIPPLERIL